MLNEYLKRLKEALPNETEERDEILNFMEEMIHDRMENGERIEDILTSLGDPETVAESFSSEVSEESKKIRQPEETVKHYEYRDIFQIEIDSISCSYEFFPSEDDRFLIDIESDNDPRISVKCQNGTLKIEQEPIETDFRDMFRTWSITKNLFGRNVLIRIALPQESCCDLQIENVSGSVSLKDVALKKTEIESVSGPVTLADVFLVSFTSENVSGSVSLQNVTIQEKLKLEMVSGTIRSKALNCPDISLETVSGTTDLQIDGRKQDYEIDIEKLFKDEHIPGNGNCRLKIESVSGTIRYGFNE